MEKHQSTFLPHNLQAVRARDMELLQLPFVLKPPLLGDPCCRSFAGQGQTKRNADGNLIAGRLILPHTSLIPLHTSAFSMVA